MVLRTCLFTSLLFTSTFGDDVDVDYYFSGLRTGSSLPCKSYQSQVYCQIKCNTKHALCIEDECNCITADPAIEKLPDISHLVLDSIFALRPTLRHHIAHFCANHDAARACIRKCMALGKPAFCGKDHVCYCGHKYTHTAKDDGRDEKELYAQFKDMYEKYFGPGYIDKNVDV